MSRPLFFPVIRFNFHEEDSPAEKVLDLPARSRFGEGRAEPLTDLTRTLKTYERPLFLPNTKVTHNI
jgi:hypothetical protein